MSIALKDLYDIPGKVVVTAHRGFSGRYPENTLAAFLAAVKLGADIIEFDIRGTKDGVPIVLHDPTFDRTANRPGAPNDYLLSEIKTFEASYWQGSHESGIKLTAPAVPGTRIPTLAEVLNSTGNTVGFNIQVYDTSPALLAEICRLYRAYDLYERGYLTMDGFKEAECVRKLDKDIQLCVLESAGRMNAAALKQQKVFGCRYLQPRRNDVTPEFCHMVKELGLCANMFYANTAEDNQMFIRLGIQGILTDHPDVLKATLRNMWLR